MSERGALGAGKLATGSRGTVAILGAALVAVAFGLLTIREGGAVLFGDGTARRVAGQYVPFVVWFNFVAGFAYVVAGTGLGLRQRWAVGLALAITVATLVAFAAFGVHVAAGRGYEVRTVIAMTVRSGVWLAISAVAYRFLRAPGTGKA